MKEQGLTPVGIFERLHASNLPIRYDTVLSWFNGVRNPSTKLNLVRHFDGNVVELIGLMVGDGNWGKIIKRGSYLGGRILYGSKDIELATRAGSLMALAFGRRMPYRPIWSRTQGVFIVSSGSKHFAEILPTALKVLKNVIWRFRVRFLRGIYDAEGSLTVRVRNNLVYPRIYLTNSDVEILGTTQRMLTSIGIKFTMELNTRAGKEKVILGRHTLTRANVYNICIAKREHFLKFAGTIGFRIEHKQELLQAVVLHLQAYFDKSSESYSSFSRTTTSRFPVKRSLNFSASRRVPTTPAP